MKIPSVAAVLFALVLAVPVALGAASPADGAPGKGEMQDYLVGFHVTPQDRSDYGGDRVKAVDDDLRFFVVQTRNPAGLEARAREDANVRYVEPDRDDWVLAFTPNDPLYGESSHYGTKVIDAQGAWDRTLGSTAVKVAVVDTGINRNHEDFVGGRVLQGRDAVNNDNDPEDGGGQCAYHGSHTAGTAAASTNNAKGIAGVAQASILPVKIFNQGGFGGCSTTTTAIVNGLKYAGDQGAHVSSNSWGGGSSSTAINDAITYAHNKGTIHVAAAGNSGSCTNCVGQPWKDMGAISIVVSCSTASDAWCSFSSQGPQVDLIAPGSGILSVDGGTTTGYKTMSGTSMSTPHVSGVVALMKTLSPSMTFSQVEGKLKASADDLGMISDRQGAGRLNACKSVDGTTCGGTGGGDPAPEPDPSAEMHVHNIAHRRQGNPNTGNLLIDVQVRDANEGGVSTVNVCIEVTKHSTGQKASGCADTNSSGDITFQWGGVGRDTYTTCVTSLTKSGWTWNTAADHASSGSCHTGSN